MRLHVYRLPDGSFIIPTVQRTPDGIHLEAEPVDTVTAPDAASLTAALKRAMERGNPAVPRPSRRSFPQPVVVESAGAKSWRAFEEMARLTTIDVDGGAIRFAPTERVPGAGFQEKAGEMREFAGPDALPDVVGALLG
ncbi:MAG: hypothetical protein JWO05_3473 [Gemmatimonadetes bacterium]|nr:hypothetical protein [Gemmatimonadota bacterium]